MSPEAILLVLARLNVLLEAKYHGHLKKLKRFKTLQMSLIILSSSIAIVMFVIYHASIVQMIFILAGFNTLFFVGFKPRSHYNEASIKKKMQKVISLQVSLRKYIMGEEAHFDGVPCSLNEGWISDKWGFHKENERIDYGDFLYDKHIKGLYLQALQNRN